MKTHTFTDEEKRAMHSRYRKNGKLRGTAKQRTPGRSPASTAAMFGEISTEPLVMSPEYRRWVNDVLGGLR